MWIVNHRKLFYSISGILVIGSIVAMLMYGFNFGIDFKGGAILEVEYTQIIPSLDTVNKALSPLKVDATARQIGESGYLIRMKSLSEPERVQVLQALEISGVAKFEQKRFDSIGAVLGNEAAKKSVTSIVIVILAIVLFIAFAFRHVSEPVSSWKYGMVAVIALIHDVIVPTGIFVILGHFKGFEIDTLFVTALLVILGFSVHDTIVVFDRVRENLKVHKNKPFAHTVGESISQTFTRSINTSLTVVFSLLVLYFFGGEATHNFTLTLLIGIIAGTYSSIFIGSPLLVTIQERQARKNKQK
ncbi:MAG: protein translocase subunit SecF [Candidatus Zambryskibacteria bacterium]|nr:protein translocase subunit SecF [Candidatus Zambryskibacteria bacterium]